MAERVGSLAGFIATCKEFVSLVKDAALVSCLGLIILFPTWAKEYLHSLGFNSVATPLGQIELARSQVRDSTAILTDLEKIRGSLPQGSDAASALDTAIQALQVSTVRAQTVVAEIQPNAVPTTGWVYLGTLDETGKSWNHASPNRAPRVVENSPNDLKPGFVIEARVAVNLRSEKPGADGSLSRVIGVIRAGQKLKILELDISRSANRDQENVKGTEMFAKVATID